MATTASAPTLTRRQLLKAGAGAVVAAGAGEGLWQILNGSSSRPSATQRFRSRPDLNPPPIEVLIPARNTAPGLVMLTAARTADYQHGPMIIDNAGELVWFAPRTGGSMNLQVQSYGGRPVLTWWEGHLVLPSGYGRGEYVIAGPDYREITRVRGGNGLMGDLHEFVLTPAGTALFTAYQPRARDLSSVGGPRRGRLLDSLLQEVDVQTGKVRFQWSAADHINLQESYLAVPDSATDPYDFFHMNSIDVTADGNLLISARHTSTIYKIERSTGAVLWRLGGKHSDFKMGAGSRFWFQHHARGHQGGVLTVFDDGAGPYRVEKSSRGLKLAVDEQAKAVSLLTAYHPHPSVLASSQGSVQLLPNGNVFVGWGSQPYFTEHASDGTIRFDGRIGSTSNSYRAFRSAWTGDPSESPSIAVERSGRERVNVYASWNGATEVARWDVLAGNMKAKLLRVGSFAKRGFETTMQVNTAARYLAVEARNRSGASLGQSQSVAASPAV